MRRIILSLALLALAAPAAAQLEEPGGPEELSHPVMVAARHAVISFLDLSPDQVDAWDVLWTEHRDAEAPIVQAIRDVQTAIDDLFAGGAPDPTELGLLIIDRRDLGDALIDVHVVYIEGFEELLDDEQMNRLQKIRIADRIERWIPSFKTFNLIRR